MQPREEKLLQIIESYKNLAEQWRELAGMPTTAAMPPPLAFNEHSRSARPVKRLSHLPLAVEVEVYASEHKKFLAADATKHIVTLNPTANRTAVLYHLGQLRKKGRVDFNKATWEWTWLDAQPAKPSKAGNERKSPKPHHKTGHGLRLAVINYSRSGGSFTADKIKKALKQFKPHSVDATLSTLTKSGMLSRLSPGEYALRNHSV